MVEFKARASRVEVSGAAVLAVLKGMGAFEAMGRRFLADNGIVDPSEANWYPQQAWLDTFRTIAERVGPATLRLIGTKIPQTAQWPATINSVEQALASIDVAYHMNHRGGEIGHYRLERAGPKSALMVCANPYPCAFDMGIIEATVQRFSPQGHLPQITHDGAIGCRRSGRPACGYQIAW